MKRYLLMLNIRSQITEAYRILLDTMDLLTIIKFLHCIGRMNKNEISLFVHAFNYS